MSSSPIGKFFNHQREVAEKKKAWLKKQLEKAEKVILPEEDDSSFKEEVAELDFLLQRNWFLDPESIVELLWDASEDVYREILTRRWTYPPNIQQVLASFLPMSPVIQSRLKIKVRAITDSEMMRQEMLRNEAQKKRLRDAWESHKIEVNLQPPVGDLDSEYDDMYTRLQQAKKTLDDVKKKSLTGRYIPPNVRDRVIASDPNVMKAEKTIETLENELGRQKQRIEQEHNAWFLRKQCDFEWKMLSL